MGMRLDRAGFSCPPQQRSREPCPPKPSGHGEHRALLTSGLMSLKHASFQPTNIYLAGGAMHACCSRLWHHRRAEQHLSFPQKCCLISAPFLPFPSWEILHNQLKTNKVVKIPYLYWSMLGSVSGLYREGHSSSPKYSVSKARASPLPLCKALPPVDHSKGLWGWERGGTGWFHIVNGDCLQHFLGNAFSPSPLPHFSIALLG